MALVSCQYFELEKNSNLLNKCSTLRGCSKCFCTLLLLKLCVRQQEKYFHTPEKRMFNLAMLNLFDKIILVK